MGDQGTGLAILDDVRKVPTGNPDDLAASVLSAVRSAGGALRRGEIREKVRVNNHRLGDALTVLEDAGRLRRGPGGWSATETNGQAAKSGELFATGTG